MKRRLILSGPIGCGKSTLIKNALGPAAKKAGGFVTVRVAEDGVLRGFDLLPACSLACPERKCEAKRFLTFGEGGAERDEGPFREEAARLLREASEKPFAVADEFGGFELSLPEFYASLETLLRGDTPLLGVLKARPAAEELKRRVGVAPDWEAAYDKLHLLLSSDENTMLLETTGRYDERAERALREWVKEYVEGI